ncbi:DUF1304 domain-containing protein [Pseudonocardia sp. GCM10023141]|uniref:DUF1304 domain-containing protein n=1 Tax=Pseudonocardia sp. GCM10023141 TaxID=3252653 RepID=UPI0036098264
MLIAADVFIALVALIHIYIVVLEMFLWRTPRARAAFGTSEAEAEATATLAANQGLYNGFLAAGLIVSLIVGGPATVAGFALAVFSLACVVVAGIYGAATVSVRILLVQSVPAAIGLVLSFLAR